MQFIEPARPPTKPRCVRCSPPIPGCAMGTQTWLRGWPRRATGQRSGFKLHNLSRAPGAQGLPQSGPAGSLSAETDIGSPSSAAEPILAG